MEYSKEDLMEAKKQIWGVGENMGTEESKKIRNPSFLVVWSALLHFLCLFSLHHFWWFATTTSVLKPIN